MPDGINIPGGPVFIGFPQPPDVPCDPTGDGWRGPPGPVGPIGPIGPQGLPGALTGGVMTGPLYWTATGSTASRSAQDRSADGVNALDYGVLLDGATNNTAFLNAARVAAKHNGSVVLPSGLIHGPLATSSGPTTAVLWKLDGTTFPDGATPITQIGAPGDTVESYYNGYKYFAKQQNPVGAFAPVVRIDLTQNLTGAGGGGIAYGLNVNATQNAGDTALVYALAVNCTNSADVTSGGMAGIQSTVSKSGGGQAWAIQTVTRDTTGLASSANGHGMVGIESAIRAVALDDASNALTWGGLGNRVALHLSLTLPVGTASGTEAQFSQGIRVSGDAVGTKCYVNSVYGVDLNVDTYQVFDSRGAQAPWNYGTNPVAALRMAAGQVVDFNGGPALNSAPGSYLQYTTSGTSRLRYMAGANEVWSVSDAGAMTIGTTLGSTSRPGYLMFNSYPGDVLNRPWFTGGNWGFGFTQSATAPATRTLQVQRDATYAGAMAGANPGALLVVNNVGSGVTGGLETAMVSTVNTSGSGGLNVSGTFNVVKTQPGPSMIVLNAVASDNSGRMSSVSGAHVTQENDLNASGPDDALIRINTEMTFKQSPNVTSADGPTDFFYAGIRCRGGAVVLGAGQGQTPPVTGHIAFGATTSDPTRRGLVGGFITPFLADGCSGAAYNAVSAVQTAPTNAAYSPGVTVIQMSNPVLDSTYIWVGALVTGAGIAASTHVTVSNYNSSLGITTLTLDNPITGSLTSGQVLTFTNAIGTGFQAGGYLTTAAFASPGFNVSPTGAVTVQNEQTIGWPTNYLQYRAATSRLYYVVAGVDQWSVDASGNVRARGTVTGSTTP